MNDNFIGGGEERAGWSRAFCVPELLFNFRTKKKLAQVGSHQECHWWWLITGWHFDRAGLGSPLDKGRKNLDDYRRVFEIVSSL